MNLKKLPRRMDTEESIQLWLDRTVELLHAIEANEALPVSMWCKKNHIEHKFGIALVRSKILKRFAGTGRKPDIHAILIQPNNIQPYHIREMLAHLTEIRKEARLKQRRKDKEVFNLKGTLSETAQISFLKNIWDYSDKEIFDELRRRGFTGTLEKTITTEVKI